MEQLLLSTPKVVIPDIPVSLLSLYHYVYFEISVLLSRSVIYLRFFNPHECNSWVIFISRTSQGSGFVYLAEGIRPRSDIRLPLALERRRGRRISDCHCGSLFLCVSLFDPGSLSPTFLQFSLFPQL